MAVVNGILNGQVLVSKVAGADLSALQYHFVKLSSGQAVACSTLGEDAFGVLQNAPKSGELAEICIHGPTKVKAGGSFSAGGAVTTAADAECVAASAGVVNTGDAGAASDPLIGSHVLGTAIEDGANTHVVQIMFDKRGAIPTTPA